MIAALRTEVRKITTTRAWWINASVMFAYMVVMAGIMAASFAVSRRAADAVAPGSGLVRPGPAVDGVVGLHVGRGAGLHIPGRARGSCGPPNSGTAP